MLLLSLLALGLNIDMWPNLVAHPDLVSQLNLA